MKTGILLAAFGSSNPQARRVLDNFEGKVRAAFPALPIRWAFTSGLIRHRLAGEGAKVDSVQKALHKMWFEKFTHVAVQSLHVVPGAEYNDLLAEAGRMGRAGAPDDEAKGFERILVGAPLLASAADAARTALALQRHLPPERAPGEAVLFMGHGTWHQGNSMYDVLAARLTALDAGLFIGTMADPAAVQALAGRLYAEGVRKVWLAPLLAVAGAHVLRDMAGEQPDSWMSVVRAAGLDCEPVLKGAAEYEAVAAIWIDHLHTAMRQLTG
jgi:sirohydrochlorin cobaltochelatase